MAFSIFYFLLYGYKINTNYLENNKTVCSLKKRNIHLLPPAGRCFLSYQLAYAELKKQ